MKNKIAYTIVRIILGLAWVFYGIMKFFPMGEAQLPGAAMDFLGAMVATGYLIPLLGVVYIAIGAMLLTNFWVPFSMMPLSAIMVNVIFFNLFLAPSVSGIIMLLVLTALQVYVMYCTWAHYKPLFSKSK